jgi:hypothetical protein
MRDVGWIGVWLLVVGAVAIVIEGALAGLWSVRLAKRTQALGERLTAEQAQLQADLERLRAAMAETQVLWRPYRRALRWLRHPIAIALLRSFVRRRVAAR